MKKLLFAATIFGLIGYSGAASADQVFFCNDNNTSLHFVLYEDGSGTRGGHMYIGGIQTAVLDTYRVNDISVRGTVAGNTAPTEFVFNSDRQQVFIEINDASEVVCNATVRSD